METRLRQYNILRLVIFALGTCLRSGSVRDRESSRWDCSRSGSDLLPFLRNRSHFRGVSILCAASYPGKIGRGFRHTCIFPLVFERFCIRTFLCWLLLLQGYWPRARSSSILCCLSNRGVSSELLRGLTASFPPEFPLSISATTSSRLVTWIFTSTAALDLTSWTRRLKHCLPLSVCSLGM